MSTLKSQPEKIHHTMKTRPTLENTRTELRTLSNLDLLSNLERLNRRERRINALVLLYLSEIDTRELYLPMGYSSLFDFCTKHLGYTRATAGRRIRAARATAEYPEALEMLRSGEINITTLSMISDILDRDNHRELLESIKKKSTRQVELMVSRHRPVPMIRDTVRPVCVRKLVEVPSKALVTGSSGGTRMPNLSPTEDTESRKSNKISLSAETTSGRPDATPCDETKISPKGRVILEQRLKLGFSVSPEFLKKYNKIKSLLSSRFPEGIDFETLFDYLMNDYLERHDPDKRRARRAGRNNQRSSVERGGKTGTPRSSSRHIPPAVRDRVYARDGGRCTFTGANGKRCNSTWDIEIDHIVPYARGGGNSPDNLRLLCRKHNIHQAERAYGREFMRKHMNG